MIYLNTMDTNHSHQKQQSNTLIDLFGNELTKEDFIIKKINGKFASWKYKNDYRKADFKYLRCKYCRNLIKCEYHNKNYYKCELMGCSHSEASDIRLSCVCNQYMAKEFIC